MKNKREPIFHTIPDEEFVDRKDEIENIYQLALETSDNTTHSLYLYGRRKVGKTEVLKRVYNRLFWEQDRIIPFYYTFHKEISDILEFAKDYLREFVKQYLGFIRKEPSLIRGNISLSKLLRLIKEEEYPGLKGLIENYYEHMSNRDYSEGVRNSIFAPYTVSIEGFTRAFVIIDDFHRAKGILSPEGKGDLLREFSEVLNNRFSPHLITGYSIKMLKEVFSDEVLIGASDIMELKGLGQEDLSILFGNLCKLYNVKFLKGDTYPMVNQLALNPFYIKSFIRSARRLGVGLLTLKEFQKLYFDEVTSGNIGFYLSSILNSKVKEGEKRTAIKILKVCTEVPIEGLTIGFLSEEISSDPQETFRVLMALQEGGLVEVDFGKVKGIQDPVMRDFVSFTYATVIEGQEPSFVKARMESDGLKTLSRRRSHRFSEDIKRQAEKVLESFDCQKVPKILFDFKGFSSRFGKADFFNVSEELKRDRELLHLPQVIGVTEVSSSNISFSPDKCLLLGYGFEEGEYEQEKESLWINGIFTSSPLVSDDEVEEFQREVDKIKKKIGDLKTVIWIVGKEGFTDKAIALIARNGIRSGNLTQLYHLRDLLIEERDTVQRVDADTSVRRDNEFELIIPMTSDTELVAAKAIEEIAGRANFDQDSIGQIKMALIEACINASEHSRIRDGKIYLRFIVEHDRLIIYVQNEGSSFDPSLVVEPNIDEKVYDGSKRGWGIKLMKSFMDEVRFEKVDGGTKLRMTKFIKGREDG